MQHGIFASFSVAKICRDVISFSIFSFALVNTMYVFENMATEHRVYFKKNVGIPEMTFSSVMFLGSFSGVPVYNS